MVNKNYVILFVLFVIIFIMPIYVTYGIITKENTCRTELIESVDIFSVSLHSDSTFMLGTGESYFNYYFFKEWENGKKLEHIPVSITKIIETDDETPKLKCYKTKKFSSFYNKKEAFCSVTYYNELIVPINTTQITFRGEV